MTVDTYEQIWDVSHEFLEKHVVFVNSLTSLMLDKAKQLRSQIFDGRPTNEASFASDFTPAYNELQKMGKSLQCVLNDWQGLFAREFTSMHEKNVPETKLPSNIELSFDYVKPTLDYKENQNIKMMVTYIPTTRKGVFYGSETVRHAAFTVLFTPIQKVPKVPLKELPPPGTVFLVWLDRCWHRAVANKPCETVPPAMYLIDFGETLAYEPQSRIAALPAWFDQNMPASAIKCVMTPERDRLSFSEYDIISFKVVAVEDGMLRVTEDCPQYAITRDTLTAEEIEQLDDLPQSTTNAMKAVLGYVPKDDEELCKFYDPATKRCFKGANCRMRHQPKDPDGWTMDKAAVSAFIPAGLEVPQMGTFVELIPTFVIDVNTFYAHILGNEMNDKNYADLLAKMNDSQVVAQYKPLKLTPALGELVLAKYEDVWYRASVTWVFESKISVFYIDYGNSADIYMDDVRRFEDSFRHLPKQAHKCRIANIQPMKANHLEAIDQVSASLLDQRLKALVVDNKFPYDVILFDTEGNNIGDCFVIANLALPKKPEKMQQSEAIPG